MSRRLGLDVDQMTTLVRTLKAEADQLDGTIKTVTARVREVWWEGPDATRFKGTEWVAHAKALGAAATSLRNAATSAEKQVKEQVSASSH
jgi:hypothetical protein